jgi:hypothetical protein
MRTLAGAETLKMGFRPLETQADTTLPPAWREKSSQPCEWAVWPNLLSIGKLFA